MKAYGDFHTNAKNHIGVIRRACSELRESTSWKKLLKIVLILGNALNASSSTRGFASGVKLSSLLTLSGTRTSDGTSNVLGYIVETCIDSPENASLLEVHLAFLFQISVVYSEFYFNNRLRKSCRHWLWLKNVHSA